MINWLWNLKLLGFAFLVGFLRSYAGSSGTSKQWGRLGIPIITTIYGLIVTGNLWAITIMSMAGAIAMGHGIPDTSWPQDPNADEGSDMGRFYFKLFKRNHLLADISTRGTIGLMIGLSLISIPLLKGNWFIYTLSTLGIIATQALISWRGWGATTKKIFGKKVTLLWSDLINWSIIGLLIVSIIKF